jgi:hypothetical protein
MGVSLEETDRPPVSLTGIVSDSEIAEIGAT